MWTLQPQVFFLFPKLTETQPKKKTGNEVILRWRRIVLRDHHTRVHVVGHKMEIQL
jgi:hypothetical protein